MKKISFLVLLICGSLSINLNAQIVINGDFSSNLSNWNVVNYTSGASTTISTENSNNIVKFSHSSTNEWSAIGQEIRSKLTVGKSYTFSFRYKSNNNTSSFGITFGDNSLIMHGTNIKENNSLIFDGSWHYNYFDFTVSNSFPNATEPMLAIIFNYGSAGTIYVDDILIFEKSQCATVEPSANNVSQCGSGAIKLSASGGANYLWYTQPFGGNYVGMGASWTTPSLTNSTTYYLANYDGTCESTRKPVIVSINFPPVVKIDPLPSFINVKANPQDLTGFVSPSGGILSGKGIINNSLNPSSAGLGICNINYLYTDNNGCSNNTSQSVIIYDTLGTIYSDSIHEIVYDTTHILKYDNITVTDTLIINANITGYNPVAFLNTIKIYPNPTLDKITIDCGNNYSTLNNYTIKITNNLSQTVYTSLVTKQTETIDLNSWTGKGIYFVHLIDGNSNTLEIKKIVLQ